MRICTSVSPSTGVEERSAPRPRPRPGLLCMLENLPRQFEVGDSAAGAQVVEHHRLAVTRRLAEPDIAWNDSFEDLAGEVSMDFLADLQGHAGAPVEHCEHDAAHAEHRVEPLSHELD